MAAILYKDSSSKKYMVHNEYYKLCWAIVSIQSLGFISLYRIKVLITDNQIMIGEFKVL